MWEATSKIRFEAYLCRVCTEERRCQVCSQSTGAVGRKKEQLHPRVEESGWALHIWIRGGRSTWEQRHHDP